MSRSVFGRAAVGALLLAAAATGAQAGPSQGLQGLQEPVVRLAGGACPVDRPACPQLPTDYPRGAAPGQCFAKVRTPPIYETYSETVVVAPARRDTRVIPAIYETIDQRTLVSAERVEQVTIPPTFRTVTETVVVQPGSVRVEQIPPVFDVVSESVLVQPARTEWRRSFVGPGGIIPFGARVEPTGEVLCLVEIPAVFQTVQRRVMVEPARTIEIPVPPVTQQVTRQVLDRPAQVTQRVIPAVWRMDKVRRLVQPERTDYIDVPAVTRVEPRQRLKDPGRETWSRIDCPADAIHGPPMARPPEAGETRGIPPRRDPGERG